MENLPQDNAIVVKEKLDKDIEVLKEKKALAALAQGKTTTYIKDRVYKHRKLWWANWEAMMNSEDVSERKLALVEYNKLQLRVLPTQLEGTNGQSVVVNIVGMGIEQPTPDDDYIEGEITSK
jgi:hypothetical protein